MNYWIMGVILFIVLVLGGFHVIMAIGKRKIRQARDLYLLRPRGGRG